MKTNILAYPFIAGLLILVGAGCTPPTQVKNIAGDTVIKLETNTVNAVWLTGGEDRGVMATRLKDAAAGIVEVAALDVNDEAISLEKFEATLRDSPAGMLFSAKTVDKEKKEEGYWFGRAVITDDHLVLFFPDEERIKELVSRGLLNGAFVKDAKGEDTKQIILESLGKEDFDRLLTNGVSPTTLFSQDPSVVCLRLSKSK